MRIVLLVAGALVVFVLVTVAVDAWTDLEPLLGAVGATLVVLAYALWFGWHILDWDVDFEDWWEARRKSKPR